MNNINNRLLSNHSYNSIENVSAKNQSLVGNEPVVLYRDIAANNQISPIPGTRAANFNKINGFKECLAEIKYNYSDNPGSSTFEQILGLCKPQADCIKNLALNKHGSWSMQAITLGAKKQLAALFIAEKKEYAFNDAPIPGSNDYALNPTVFKGWFMAKFTQLQSDKPTVYHDNLISNIWQQVSHENSYFGKFSGLTDITLNRSTDVITFGSGYNIRENINTLSQSDTTKTALAGTKATFEAPDSHTLNKTSILSIIPEHPNNGTEHINLTIITKNEITYQIKSKVDLAQLHLEGTDLDYLAYCSAENSSDVTMLESLSRQDFSGMGLKKDYILHYSLNLTGNSPTLKIESITNYYTKKQINDDVSNAKEPEQYLNISMIKTINLLTQKVEDYSISVKGASDAPCERYQYWANKLEQRWEGLNYEKIEDLFEPLLMKYKRGNISAIDAKGASKVIDEIFTKSGGILSSKYIIGKQSIIRSLFKGFNSKLLDQRMNELLSSNPIEKICEIAIYNEVVKTVPFKEQHNLHKYLENVQKEVKEHITPILENYYLMIRSASTPNVKNYLKILSDEVRVAMNKIILVIPAKNGGKNKEVTIDHENNVGNVTVKPGKEKKEFGKEDEIYNFVYNHADKDLLSRYFSFQKPIPNKINVRKFSIQRNNLQYNLFEDYILNVDKQQNSQVKKQVGVTLLREFTNLLAVMIAYGISNNDMHGTNMKIAFKKNFFPNTTLNVIDTVVAFDWGHGNTHKSATVQDLSFHLNVANSLRNLYTQLRRWQSKDHPNVTFHKTPIAHIYGLLFSNNEEAISNYKRLTNNADNLILGIQKKCESFTGSTHELAVVLADILFDGLCPNGLINVDNKNDIKQSGSLQRT